MRVGLVFGGRSVEHRVSISSARTVARALGEAGHEVVPLGIAPDGCWLSPALAAQALSGELDAFEPAGRPIAASLAAALAERVDAIFPVTHGTWGEDGCLQGLCEMLDLPYVGTGVTSSAVAMDKWAAKRLLAAAGIPVVEYVAVDRARFEGDSEGAAAAAAHLPLPLFVKPSCGGSSVGVRKVRERTDLESAIAFALRFDEVALIERGVAGRELECAVLGDRTLEASAIGEIVPGGEFYDYADKYLTDEAQLIAPAVLERGVAERLQEVAIAAFRALGGWGMARVDFLYGGRDELYVNELNTLPGFTSISMYPRLWGLAGLSLPALVDRLVGIAVERHRDRRRLDAGIKEWLGELRSTAR